MTDPDFFVTSMSSSRPADYWLGYREGSVFLDFNDYEDDRIVLVRISFDGYGCCGLGEHAVPLNKKDSGRFKDIVRAGINDQDALLRIVKQAVQLNKTLIWPDALQEYGLNAEA